MSISVCCKQAPDTNAYKNIDTNTDVTTMIQIRLQKQFCLITYYRVFQSAGSGRLRRPSLIQGHTTEPPRQTAQLPAFEEDDGDNEYYQYLEVFIDIDCGDYQDDGDDGGLFRGIQIYISGLQFSTNLLVELPLSFFV